MQPLGFVLIGLGVIGLLFVLITVRHIKKLHATTLHKTGELAKNPALAGPKGDVSAEGAVVVMQPINAPVSGKPALYYEITVKRKWEKFVTTENGQKRETGSESLTTSKGAGQFGIDDGSGVIAIDASQGASADLVQSFKQEQRVSSGDVMFGQFHTNVPHSFGDKHTIAVECTEMILAPEGKLYAVGALANGMIIKPSGTFGKLTLSSKGKEGHVASLKKRAIIGAVVGGLATIGGIPVAIFGGSPPGSGCDTLKDAPASCSGRVTNDTGDTDHWTVTKPGGYKVAVVGTGTNAAMRLWPHVTVSLGGKEVGDDTSNETTTVAECFDKGTYGIQIRDLQAGHVGGTIKGGAGYRLDITPDKDQQCDTGSAAAGSAAAGSGSAAAAGSAAADGSGDAAADEAPPATGVPECDDYLVFYKKCMTKAGTPASGIETGVNAMVGAYKKASATKQGKKAIASTCVKSKAALGKTCPGVQ
jgi:hypothetical protein